MKKYLALLLFLPSLVFGEPQPAPDPHAQAMARALMEAVGREVAAMTRVNVLEARVAVMEAEAKARAAPVPVP